MHQRRSFAVRMISLCAVLLAAAVVQMLLESRPAGVRGSALASAALYLQTGVRVAPQDTPPATEPAEKAPEPSPDPSAASEPSTDPDPSPEPDPSPDPEPEPPLQFDAAEADAIGIFGECTYCVDKAALLTQPLGLQFSAGQPAVLIVHTHTTEAYTIEEGWDYEELLHARTLDENYNMVRVGQAVARVLEENGIRVVHDTTVNDYPSYDGAYDRMKAIIERDLAANPGIQMVLDIHRDAGVDATGAPLAETVCLDGTEYAKLMLVMGTDQGGLEHPNWQQNLSCALKLQALLNRTHSGLCKDINLRTERFNQNQTPGSMLVEFGSDGNTLAQALRSAEVFAEALAQLI